METRQTISQGGERAPEPLSQLLAGIDRGVRVLVISGAAGTGKTTLIGSLIDALEQRRYGISLMAPTGRAAKMIQVRSGHAAATIHSVIYRIDERAVAGTAEDGNLKWQFPLRSERPARTAMIVDEASMVGFARHNDGILQFGSGSLLQDLLDYAGVANPGSDNVLVFVGDAYQLPPVNERPGMPPALDAKLLGQLYGGEVQALELTTVYRQRQDSGILAEAQKLRAAIAVHLFGTLGYQEHPDVHLVTEEALAKLYRPQVRLNDKIIIAYTNRRVWELNQRVRRLLGLESVLPVAGEHLLGLRNTLVRTDARQEARFLNGDLLQVLEVFPERVVRLDGFYRPRDREETLHYQFTFCRMKVGWLQETGNADAEVWVNVTPITSEEYRAEPEYAQLALYVAVVNQLRNRLHLRDNAPDNERLREALKRSLLYHAPWVTFGYALTGHKAQGGEWPEVWVDYEYSQNPRCEAYFRWAYTVTTRAREVLFALAPPQFDDLVAAMDRQLGKLPTEATEPASAAAAALPLKTLLARHGYAVVATIRRPYALHFEIAKADDPLASVGTLDFNYNARRTVTYLRLACAGADEALGVEVAALKGRALRTLCPEEEPEAAAAPVVEVQAGHARLRERLLAAAARAGLTVLALKSLTASQLRLELSSGLGEGYVDFYVDGQGRVSEMGSMTIGAANLRKLREGLSA